MSIKLLIADDHVIFRQGLYALIDQDPDLEVVAQAGNGRLAAQLACDLMPNIVLMDIRMPELNGIEATRQIMQEQPSVKILALSAHGDKPYVADMLHAGASGYVLKTCAFDDLVQAIGAAMKGQTYLSPAITNIVIEEYLHPHFNGSKYSVCPELSGREKEVLQLLAEGKSTRQIAARLMVSAKTIATHREHIMKKLNIHSIAELTRYALKEGLTSF